MQQHNATAGRIRHAGRVPSCSAAGWAEPLPTSHGTKTVASACSEATVQCKAQAALTTLEGHSVRTASIYLEEAVFQQLRSCWALPRLVDKALSHHLPQGL